MLGRQPVAVLGSPGPCWGGNIEIKSCGTMKPFVDPSGTGVFQEREEPSGGCCDGGVNSVHGALRVPEQGLPPVRQCVQAAGVSFSRRRQRGLQLACIVGNIGVLLSRF